MTLDSPLRVMDSWVRELGVDSTDGWWKGTEPGTVQKAILLEPCAPVPLWGTLQVSPRKVNGAFFPRLQPADVLLH